MMALMLMLAGADQVHPKSFIFPPKAAEVSGPIEQVKLSPIYRQDFVCSEHFAGQLPYAGDALGSDCMIAGGIEGNSGFSQLYRKDGHSNIDWYGWNAEVLSPTDGVIAGVVAKTDVNTPGSMGRPPAAMIQIRRADGIIVVLAHVANIRVKLGDRVTAGQVIANVGNNGMARNPHIHIGAWRESNAEPLQIRWDLQAVAKLRNEF
jgi:murein DD-endopeptidase MepM/ murein hydrolase activator NlpD